MTKGRTANPPERLVVMSWGGAWGRALAACVSEPFTRATGVKVEHAIHVGLELPIALREALEHSRRPPFDVVWSNATPAQLLARRGLTTRLARVYVVHYVLAYRRAAFPAGAPASYEVLMDRRHRGKIAMYPGGNGFHALAQVLGGGRVATIPDDMEACWSYVRALAPQLGRLEYSIGMEALFAGGQLDLAFRALPNALAFQQQGVADWVVPREGVPETFDALWIPRGLPAAVAPWSDRYVDFALSKEVQERWCAALGALPASPEAAPPPLFSSTRRLPRSIEDVEHVLRIPEEVKLDHERRWEARFDAIASSAHGHDVDDDDLRSAQESKARGAASLHPDAARDDEMAAGAGIE